jgi:hypothetical protein
VRILVTDGDGGGETSGVGCDGHEGSMHEQRASVCKRYVNGS